MRATTVTDRWLMVITALLIGGIIWHTLTQSAGQIAVVYRHNQPMLTLSLAQNQQTQVEGKLGPVVIQVQDGQIRMLEYASPRMIATRGGWISASGAILVCVPCDILIQVEGTKTDTPGEDQFDSIAR